MTIQPHPVIGPWKLADIKHISKNQLNVLSCFHCGGGSTMGYKLAGYNVLGGVEIDPQMMAIYKINHNPKHSFMMGVQEFNEIPVINLPSELSNLDILDGSPPCSVFSMAGKREKKWGDEHHFREGQVKQRLDDLFFHFIDTAKNLQPKVLIAENVKGLISGAAKGYVKEIFAAMKAAGYLPQLFLLNASCMGVPQRRQRVFFIAQRQDLQLPKLIFNFTEPIVSIKTAFVNANANGKTATPLAQSYWEKTTPGKSFSNAAKGSWFNHCKLAWSHAAPTLCSASSFYHPTEPRHLSDHELIRIQSFPEDYNFLKMDPKYIMGMSVPPLMTQRIALEIALQWFNIDYNQTPAQLLKPLTAE